MYYPGYAQVQVHENYVVKTMSNVSTSFPMVVTTSTAHGYAVGLNVAFLVPSNWGMVQLNSLNGNVIAVDDDLNFEVDIDSTNFTAFATPSPLPTAYTPASVVPNAEGRNIPPLIPPPEQNSLVGTIYNNGIS